MINKRSFSGRLRTRSRRALFYFLASGLCRASRVTDRRWRRKIASQYPDIEDPIVTIGNWLWTATLSGVEKWDFEDSKHFTRAAYAFEDGDPDDDSVAERIAAAGVSAIEYMATGRKPFVTNFSEHIFSALDEFLLNRIASGRRVIASQDWPGVDEEITTHPIYQQELHRQNRDLMIECKGVVDWHAAVMLGKAQCQKER